MINQKEKRGEGFEVEISKLEYKLPHTTTPIVNIKENLKFNSGEFISIVGLNGAGKSTLLRIITGNLSAKERKNYLNGSVKIGGQYVTKPVNQIIDGVGIVHQQDEIDLILNLSVAQNIAIRQLLGGGHIPKLIATPNDWRTRISRNIASKCPQAAQDLSREVFTLSGGERKMLSVTIAVHLEHEVLPCGLLILDEHTAGLDHSNSMEIMEFTAHEVKESNATCVMVTHEYNHAIRFSDRIIIMRDGNIFNVINNNDLSTRLSIEDLAQLVEGGNE